MTNSEKTTTTRNLSQHKYLRIRRQLHQETENHFLAIRRDDVINVKQVSSRCVATGENDRQRAAPSVPFNKHQYAIMSDSENQWRTLYHHYTNYQRQSVSGSCRSTKVKDHRTAAKAEPSHLRKPELSKLLTSIQLTPHAQVIENQQSNPLSNLHRHQTSSTSISSDEDSLCRSGDIETPDFNSYTMKKCSPQYSSMALSKSVVVSVPNIPCSGMDPYNDIDAPNSHSMRNSLYNEYFETTLHRLYARRERNKTRSAPGRMCKSLPIMQKHKASVMIRPESSPISLSLDSDKSQRSIRKQPTKKMGMSELRAEKDREVYNKPHPLIINSRPRSHWYEMRTPEFHIEARRNNDFIRKSFTY